MGVVQPLRPNAAPEDLGSQAVPTLSVLHREGHLPLANVFHWSHLTNFFVGVPDQAGEAATQPHVTWLVSFVDTQHMAPLVPISLTHPSLCLSRPHASVIYLEHPVGTIKSA